MSTLLLWALVLQAPTWVGQPPVSARRVVSLAPSLTEIAFALGKGERIVGVTRYDDYPPEVQHLPKVGGLVDPDPEAVLAQKPDLVMAAAVAGSTGRLEDLGRFGVPVMILPTETLADLWQAITEVGMRLDAQEAAGKLVEHMRHDLDGLRVASSKQPRVRLLIIVGYRPLVAAGPDSFVGKLLPAINADNALSTGGAFPQLDLEAALAARPDVIVEATMSEPAPADFWQKLIDLSQRPPRIVELRDERLLRPGPRLVDGLRALAQLVRAPR